MSDLKMPTNLNNPIPIFRKTTIQESSFDSDAWTYDESGLIYDQLGLLYEELGGNVGKSPSNLAYSDIRPIITLEVIQP